MRRSPKICLKIFQAVDTDLNCYICKTLLPVHSLVLNHPAHHRLPRRHRQDMLKRALAVLAAMVRDAPSPRPLRIQDAQHWHPDDPCRALPPAPHPCLQAATAANPNPARHLGVVLIIVVLQNLLPSLPPASWTCLLQRNAPGRPSRPMRSAASSRSRPCLQLSISQPLSS